MFPGGKGGRCVGLTTLAPSCVPIVLKSGNLKLLEPSGPVQACNGVALPLPYIYIYIYIYILHIQLVYIYIYIYIYIYQVLFRF